MDKGKTARGIAVALALAMVGLGLGAPTPARAQLTPSEEKLQILTDPESLRKKVEKDRARPPIEIFRSQIAPFDVLPYVKANHWSTLGLELRANYEEYAGVLQTAPVALRGLPLEIIARRDARLPRARRSRLALQVYLPEIPKELGLELVREDAVRADERFPASLRVLERQQMLILILSKESNNAFALWNRYQALYPHEVDRGDLQAVEKHRYYRLVLPTEPERPPLSPHPLTWTTISHVIWDGLPPDSIDPARQQAMLDWLHWGGQLVIIGGAGPTISILQDSFLSPYLPADATGANALLTKDDLQPLSAAYRPPFYSGRGLEDEAAIYQPEPVRRLSDRYKAPVPITPAPNRPVFLMGLKPRPGAVGITLGESGDRLIGVERRVGRGRVLMLALNPTDPALASWPGLDTFVRRVVLRRPEESRGSRSTWTGRGWRPPRYGPLPGPDLSWVRLLSRDLKAIPTPSAPTERTPAPTTAPATASVPPAAPTWSGPGIAEGEAEADNAPIWSPEQAVAEWDDDSTVPRLCRAILEDASGIKIPDAGFVLQVILAYVIAVVPLNWLVCRYLIGRRELAWLIVPALALGFAIGVERAAAYDLGYDSSCDEIDLVEMFGGYPRAHVSRFASLYTTGRARYAIRYPNDPTALCLPLDNGRSLRGEDVGSAVWQSFPVPSLTDYLVQPRSLALFRSEQLTEVDGAVSLVSENGTRTVVNQGSVELRGAVLVDVVSSEERRETYLGTIPPGGSVAVKPSADASRPSASIAELNAERLLKRLRESFEDRPENAGEIRLVAWMPRPVGGQSIEPAVDRHRGISAFIIHLRLGPPPSPDGPIYDALAGQSQSQPGPATDAAPIKAPRAVRAPRSQTAWHGTSRNVRK